MEIYPGFASESNNTEWSIPIQEQHPFAAYLRLLVPDNYPSRTYFKRRKLLSEGRGFLFSVLTCKLRWHAASVVLYALFQMPWHSIAIYIPCAYFAGSPPTPIIDAPWLTDTQVAEYSKELAALAEESLG